MTVPIKPNNKCNNCRNYVDSHCLARSVPRFCGNRYQPLSVAPEKVPPKPRRK